MTLVIGMKFNEGVLIVSDRKVADPGNFTVTWEKKLQTPDPNKELVIGAAGYSDLFNEFNRKIPLKVEERLREVNVNNLSVMKKLGLEGVPKEEPVTPKNIRKSDVEEAEQTALNSQDDFDDELPFQPPYIYSTEDFLDDCKLLMRQICSNFDSLPENKLDVLLIMLTGNTTRLHHIDFSGREEERNYYAIGSGSTHVNIFLDKYWSIDRPIDYLIKLAYFCIYYVQDMKLDSFVGVESDKLPDQYVILNNKEFGIFQWKAKDSDLIKEMKEKVVVFEKIKDNLNF
jgi:20S proteasome alpha/beta subunit